MSNNAEDRTENDNIMRKDSDRVIGFAVKLDVAEVAQTLPAPSDIVELSSLAGRYILERYSDTHQEPYGGIYFVLRNGIRDTGTMIGLALHKIPHALTFEQALTIVHNPVTAEEIALLAMRPEAGTDGLDAIISEPGKSYMLSPDHTALWASPHIEPQRGGCPVAGDSEALTIHPTPLFRKFIAWSGELALRSLYYRDQQ